MTVRLPSATQRTRTLAGPALVLWVAVLLFGLVAGHGVCGQSAQGHSMLGAARAQTEAVAHPAGSEAPEAPSARTTATDAHHEHGEGSPHPAEDCVAAQPQQAPPLAAPCAPAPAGDTPVAPASSPAADGREAHAAPVPWLSARSSVVQQV